MSYAIVNHTVKAAVGNAGVTTTAMDTSGADFLFVAATTYQAASEPVLTDSQSNAWTALTSYSTAGNGRVTGYYCIPSSVGSGHTFSLSDTDSFASIEVLAFSGAKASSVLDQQTGASNAPSGTSSAQPGSLTPSEDNCLLIATMAQTGDNAAATINSSFTTDSSFQVLFDSGVVVGGAVAYQIQTTATARNPTWTLNTNASGGNGLAVFKSAGAAATTYHNLTLLGVG